MASLTDAYDRQVGGGGGRGSSRSGGDGEHTTDAPTTRGRPYLGLGALALSSALVAGGIVLATSVTAATAADLSAIEANKAARVLSALGLVLTFVGVLAVVPTSRRLNGLASIGFVLAAGGVASFWWAYPDRWLGDPLDLTVPVVTLYAVGLLLTFLALVAGVFAFGRETGDSTGSEAETGTRDRSGRTSLR